MIRHRALLVALVAGAAPSARAEELNVPPRGFTALFNGKDVGGWHGMKHRDPRELLVMSAGDRSAMRKRSLDAVRANWRVEDGELVNGGSGPYLTTDRDYGDIELLIEYRTVARADSGIYLRATPQVQIWDTTKQGGKWKRGADRGSGGLFNNRPGRPGQDPLVLADKPFGEWNKFRIVQVGSRTSVWLNDKLVVDGAIMENWHDKTRELPLCWKGPVQLQTHGGEIRWRNIFVREIAPEEANRLLEDRRNEGFRKIFNGKDFEGWAWKNGKPVTTYEVRDGAIVCKKGTGGTIYYNKELGDFVARFEFKLPPGGNNGLAIRYPGSGDTAYTGMCELQILDDPHRGYADLDPRQYHGSAYGMVPAHRGYLRPAGTWNFQEVTVKGSTIKVELNGTVILDADLAEVKEFMGNRSHVGKDRTSGYFGFAGHGSPVMCRNVRLKELKPRSSPDVEARRRRSVR
ncbi:MAG: DUF1080 domain-containing protein [Planctomycetota bacterium]|nr:DUF1080 domain-containing protein [Planctomycetota bacterium]